MNKIIKISSILIISILLSACQNNEAKKIVYTNPIEKADKLEIIHFHGNYQCYSCIYIGDKSEEIINKHFAEEIEAGILKFEKINVDLEENKDIVNEFQARTSSMHFKSYSNNNSTISEDSYIWILIDQDEKLEKHLVDKINNILK